MKYFLILLLFSFVFCQREQTLRHYTIPEVSYGPILYYERSWDMHNIPELFTREIKKTCFTGHMMFYPAPNYEPGGIFMSGINKCVIWKDEGFTPQSQRFLGSYDNYEGVYMHLFEGKNFTGHRISTYQDTPWSSYQIPCFVLTGTRASVTLYSSQYYKGFSYCIKNEGVEISIANPDFSKTIGMDFVARSYKFGCHSSNVLSVV